MNKLTLFAGLTLSIGMILIACKMDTDLGINTSARPLAPQDPMPPQIQILNPVKTWVTVNGCSGWEYPEVKFDTVQLKFSVAAGRTWWGGQDKLVKYRIVVDNVILIEQDVTNGTKFPMTYIINVPDKSLWNTNLLSDTFSRKWHSVGVTAWQTNNSSSSQGTYFYIKP